MKNLITKGLSIVLVLAMCLSTFVIGVYADTTACTEPHDGEGETQKAYGWQDPTCTEMGGYKFRCLECNTSYALETVAPLGHAMPEKGTVKDPTCTEGGYTEYVCTRENCNETVRENVTSALGHNYQNVEGTCESQVCSRCGDAKEEGAHKWVEQESTVIKPTCTEQGTMTYKCSVDGCIATKEVEILARGHKTEAVAAVTATKCGDTVVAAHYKCTNPGCTLLFEDQAATKVTTLEALTSVQAHLNPTTTTVTYDKLNCTKTTTVYCADCNASSTETVPFCYASSTEADAADYIVTDTKAAGCRTWGHKYELCSICGKYLTEPVKYEPTGHSFEEKKDGVFAVKADATPIATVEPGCFTPGYKTYHCATCNEDIDVQYAPAYGKHDIVTVTPAVAPTCTQPGSTAATKCSRCNEANVAAEEVDATGHAFADKKYEETCIANAFTCKECTVCGYIDPATIVESTTELADGTSHNWKKIVDKEESCVENGYYTQICTLCDTKDFEHHEIDEIEDGHDWVWKYDVPGTCSSPALRYSECSKCGEGKPEMGALDTTDAGHRAHLGEEALAAKLNAGEYTVERPGTCDAAAALRVQCSCGEYFYIQGEFGHNLIDETIDAECSTGATGISGKFCTLCEQFIGETTTITHTADAEMPAQAYVCKSETAGWTKFNYCSICAAKATTGEAYIAALKEANKDIHEYSEVAKQDATCTADGWNAYCSVCQKATDAGIKLEKTGHDYSATRTDTVWGSYTKTADCVNIGYAYHYCPKCGDDYIDAFVDELGHDWEDEGEVTPPTCTAGGYTTFECERCDATKTEAPTDATGHKNAAGDTITEACTDTVTDRFCVACNAEIAKKHQYTAATTYAPTCTENGYTIALCDYCGEETLTDFVAAAGHTWDAGVVTLAPTPTTAGSKLFTCTVCEATKTEAIDPVGDIVMNITWESGIKEGFDNVVNGGIIEFTVALNIADIDAAILQAEFYYNTAYLTYLGAEINGIFDVNEEGLVIETSKNAFANEEGAIGKLTLIVAASKTADNKAVDVNLNGESVALATLKFRISEEMYTDKGTAVGDSFYGVVTEVVNVAGEMVVENKINAGIVEEIEADRESSQPKNPYPAVAVADYEINKLGSVNGDDVINTIDLLAVRQIAMGDYTLEDAAVSYLAEADIDMDGDVDMDDYMYLVNYLVNKVEDNYIDMVLTSQAPVVNE